MAARKLRRKAAPPPAPKKKVKKAAPPRRRRVRRTAESDRLYARAKAKMPGGVSSPVRSFKSVGATPFFVKKAKGSVLVDADGNRYVDYVMSYGPHLFGHMPKAVATAIRKALPHGTSYGAPCRAEVELAERVSRLVPSMEKVRFVSSGTEAAMSAVRLARAVTGRDLVLKFAGCYHGHADSFLVAAGSGVATLGIPGSPGVPADLAKATLTATYNDLASVEALFKQYPGQIAVIAVEPVAANMGVVLPKPGFLEGLRKIADREKALLLFDEVITGFRLARGGAQEVFGIQPDLTCLGKILGGGLPVGAYGGRADLMAHVAPDGPVYQAGTLSGNPLAMAAGIAMLDSLTPAAYAKLERTAARLEKGMRKVATELGFADRLTLNRIGSILTLFFNPGPIADFDDVKKSDGAAFSRWFHGLLKRGVFIAPAAFEAMFVSTAHTEKDLERTLKAHREALKEAFAQG